MTRHQSDLRAAPEVPASGGPIWQLEAVGLDGARPRLRDVTCTIGPGVTLVCGPSGAGKTSLLDLLVGFTAPSRGRVVCHAPARAWAPADFALWPHLNVRAHLEQVHPGPSPTAHADRLLRALDLEGVAAAMPRELSSGQQSRVALARALATTAPAIVLDEPFAHLGDGHARACAAVLGDAVSRAGVAVVVATHAPQWLAEVVRERLDLHEGRLVNVARSACALLLSVLLLLTAACGVDATPTPLRSTGRVFAVPPAEDRAPAPRAVAAEPSGSWLVLDNAGRVLRYAGEGRLLAQWQMPAHDVGNPEGVCPLADGTILVADTHYHRLVLFAGDGALLRCVGSQGDGPLQFRYPVSVAQDANGAVYVAEYGGNDRVQKLTAGLEFTLAFGSFGTGPAQLQRPAGLACAGDHVYVADAMNGRVQVYSSRGDHVASLPALADLACPYDVAALEGGDLLVTEHAAGQVLRLSPSGRVVGSYGTPGRGLDQLATPWSVAVQRGHALIADTGNKRLVEIEL